MLRFLTLCLPVAATLGGAAYVASDRAVLAQIGLAPGRGELRSLSAPRHPAPRRPAGIRQGGPVCYDVPLWPADGGGLPVWPGYNGPLYGHPGAFTGLSAIGGYGGGAFGRGPLSGQPIIGRSIFAGDYPGTGAYDVAQVIPVGAPKPVPVPEPMSMALFLVGLGGLWLVKGRRV